MARRRKVTCPWVPWHSVGTLLNVTHLVTEIPVPTSVTQPRSQLHTLLPLCNSPPVCPPVWVRPSPAGTLGEIQLQSYGYPTAASLARCWQRNCYRSHKIPPTSHTRGNSAFLLARPGSRQGSIARNAPPPSTLALQEAVLRTSSSVCSCIRV